MKLNEFIVSKYITEKKKESKRIGKTVNIFGEEEEPDVDDEQENKLGLTISKVPQESENILNNNGTANGWSE